MTLPIGDTDDDFNRHESILGLWPRVPHANVLIFDKQEKEAFVFDLPEYGYRTLGRMTPNMF